MHILVEKFCNYYKEFSQESIPGLDEMYHQNVILQDPFSKLEGLDNVKQHFSQMMQNVSYCRFEIINVVSNEGQAFITWTMMFAHPKLNNHEEIVVDGVSDIKFDERISYHRDYFDVGAMFYEHVPVVKGVIKMLKKRLTV
ncbi:nuclear transport factor 2 family protein [Oceanospirillaceae bacterium]|jgi:limonene-1,2-epoxide hydrolase|uniref:nuclear transport factor 2 family protein n=1 Tax=Candidatus Njordibacter sp. Uisw_002 TaxID=3230971 RepID=UPI0023377C82|nr:nuclear transport factor 2 family protein [Oceanospirillaceae bacterium]MDB9753707.1 nuclear transport factor 2 family protein [Oceanospirillaceae bacterium]MDB9958138.1 nuclear transport factor 2 family protein [Oceanospirillaceae bacterium]MDC1340660.1 nuclear transport factor 2 family protein [Oceanospirillaceae bacterium]MDC1509401.1 nuclear transport factor 2 family protein [Oceanospirillaceae bacterium]|tara:strand:- start:4426 stop:4848 length:423 start_codon:yes stop_codon:yes gene_type:complete